MFSPYVSESSFLIFFLILFFYIPSSILLLFSFALLSSILYLVFIYPPVPPRPRPPLLSFSVYNESLYAPLISSIDICCHDQSVVFLGLTRLFAKPTFFKMLLEGKIKTVIFNYIYFASTKSILIDDQPMLSMLIIVFFNFYAFIYQTT